MCGEVNVREGGERHYNLIFFAAPPPHFRLRKQNKREEAECMTKKRFRERVKRERTIGVSGCNIIIVKGGSCRLL
jgi:hypothetical protein